MIRNKISFLIIVTISIQYFIFSFAEKKENTVSLYEPTWNSLGRHTIPEWFKDAKFGINTEFKEVSSNEYTGKDIRFTVKDDFLYAIFLDWPGEEARIYSLRRFEKELSIHWEEEDIESIIMLGVDQEQDWFFTDDALVIKVPDNKPYEHAYTLRIKCKMI